MRISLLAHLTLLTLPALSFAASGKITRTDCPSFDYTSHFGPPRMQYDLPLCAAFAAAAIFEEEACLEDKSMCGKNVSATSLTRCETDLDSGQDIGDALDCGLAQGVCEEKYAPYFRQKGGVFAGIFSPSAAGSLKRLTRFYRRWKDVPNEAICKYGGPDHPNDSSFSDIRELIGKFRKIKRHAGLEEEGMTDHDALDALAEAQDAGAVPERVFLGAALVPRACNEHRLPIKAQNVRSRPTVHPLEDLVAILKGGRSAATGICTDSTARVRDGGVGCAANDVGHAVVINGMKWNPGKNRCEVHVRNSWGKKAAFTGWIRADQFLKKVTDYSYLY